MQKVVAEPERIVPRARVGLSPIDCTLLWECETEEQCLALSEIGETKRRVRRAIKSLRDRGLIKETDPANRAGGFYMPPYYKISRAGRKELRRAELKLRQELAAECGEDEIGLVAGAAEVGKHGDELEFDQSVEDETLEALADYRGLWLQTMNEKKDGVVGCFWCLGGHKKA